MKRILDAVFSVLFLIILSPVFLLVALLIRLDSPGAVLFIQPRLGQWGRIFQTVKFRTMSDKPRKSDREIIGRDPELTRVGYWLRRLKIDEFPQLVNVVKGDMSMVGPRPALPTQMSEYDEISRRRLEIRPGLTGLAQVSGNIYLSWQERWKYDVDYVNRISFCLDLSITLRTIGVMILGEKRFKRTLAS